MSIAIVYIRKSNLTVFKKLMKALDAKVSILKDAEEEQKRIMLKLIEESDESKNISEEIIKKDFQEYGVDL